MHACFDVFPPPLQFPHSSFYSLLFLLLLLLLLLFFVARALFFAQRKACNIRWEEIQRQTE
jgi:hypothetical protein